MDESVSLIDGHIDENTEFEERGKTDGTVPNE